MRLTLAPPPQLLAILMAHTTGVGQGWHMFVNVFLGACVRAAQGQHTGARLTAAATPAVLCFYVATWETFHTHTLYLGYINGPVDGTLGLCVCFALTGVYGRQALWTSPVTWIAALGVPNTPLAGVFDNWRVNDVGYAVFTTFSLLTVLGRSGRLLMLQEGAWRKQALMWRGATSCSIYNVAVYLQSWRRFGHALLGLLPLAAWSLAGLVWLWFSPGGILRHRLVALALALGVEFAMMVVRGQARSHAWGSAVAHLWSYTATDSSGPPDPRALPIPAAGPDRPRWHCHSDRRTHRARVRRRRPPAQARPSTVSRSRMAAA
jgi:hypothetical protein